jgi:hypothetical protein
MMTDLTDVVVGVPGCMERVKRDNRQMYNYVYILHHEEGVTALQHQLAA